MTEQETTIEAALDVRDRRERIMSDELRSALYDVMRALEITMSSLTSREDQIGVEHVHALAEEPMARVRLHLESAAKLAGVEDWAFEYIEPTNQGVSR